MAASDAYDVLVLVHDFPYRSLPSEVATANEVTAAAARPRPRDRPDILPVYVSLTSGEPPPETKALLDDEGGGRAAAARRGRGVPAIAPVARVGGAQRGAAGADGPWRPGWPALAADRTSYGADSAMTAGRAATQPPPADAALSERDSLDLAAGRRRRRSPRPSPCRTRTRRSTRRPAHRRRPVVLKLDARRARPQDRHRRRRASGCTATTAVRGAARRLFAAARRHGLAIRGLLVEPMAEPGIELIVGLRRDPPFGPAVLVGLGGILAEVLDDVAIRLGPCRPRRRPWRCSTSCAALAARRGPRPARRSIAPPSPG